MKALITWHPKPGDPRSHEWAGYTFSDGDAVTVTDDAVITKLTGNPFFTVEAIEGAPVKRRGRPPKNRVD